MGIHCSSAIALDQPNVLIVMADDCTHSDLSIYGGANAKTPNIEQLASEGLTFQRAYLIRPCVSHVRGAVLGMFPMGNGCKGIIQQALKKHKVCRITF